MKICSTLPGSVVDSESGVDHIKIPMSDVSCRTIQSFAVYLESRGVALDEFYAQVEKTAPGDNSLKPGFAKNGSSRISFDSFLTVCDVMAHFLPDEESQAGLFTFSAKAGSVWMPWQKAVQLLSSPRAFYFVYSRLIAPVVFGKTLQMAVGDLPDGRLSLRIEIPKTVRSCRLFFSISRIGLVKMPMIIGLPDAIVEAEVTDHVADYTITLPRSMTLWARVRRTCRMLFFPGAAFTELVAQERQIRADYVRVLSSESKLQAVRNELESRVRQRTAELEEINRQLQGRIQEITHKEKENTLLQERLLHGEKLRAIGTVAGGISHEINNVLHGIFLSLEAIERDREDQPRLGEDLMIAKKFAKRGQDLMKQVLSFSRKAKIEKRLVPVEATVRDAIRTLATTLSKDVKIIEDYESVSGKELNISGDETQLQQIVINLCSNAADTLSEAGGTIRIRLHCPHEASVVIAISDTGPGIPDEIKQKIFEPFFTTKPFGAGLGMGLAVVHGIVHAYGGEIVFRDLTPNGTEFQVTLPQCVRSRYEEISLVEIESAGGTENILLVDDEIEIVNLLKDTLTTFGYNVLATHDTTEAQRLFRAHPIDLVLTDLTMPGMTGIALARALKAIRPKVPIVLCTGFSDTKLKTSEDALFAGFTTKPLDGFAINDAIRAALTS